MKYLSLIASALAMLGLTACEKGLVDEGQTLNIGLTEGTYSVYAVGGASSSDYVLTDDEMPSNVAKLKFYYLGGSSTFSPKDGYGCVNSVNRDWAVTFILDVTNLC